MTTYTYDPQGQVSQVVRGGVSTGYGYDSAGNRIQVTAATQGLRAQGLETRAKSEAATSSAPANASPLAAYDGVVVLRPGQVRVVDVVANDSDTDALTVSALSATSTPLAAYSLVGGLVQIQAGAAEGAETITYTVSDGRGGTASAPLSITVTSSQSSINSVPAAGQK